VSAALVLDGVVKRFGRIRPKVALDGLSFSVPTGAICGFIGPNGAGKTTAFSVVCGYLRADAGRVDILGQGSFDAARLKGRIGVLPQDAELGHRHTPLELVTHLGLLQGLRGGQAEHNARELLGRLHLADRAEDRIGSLSHGMRRRVAVASALIGDPGLVLLDEPMSGLDPAQVASLRSILAEQRGRRTLVVSSHNLSELELICDVVVMIQSGRCVREGPVAMLTARNEEAAWELGPGELPLDRLRALLPQQDLVLEGRLLRQRAASEEALDAGSVEIARVLAEAGVSVRGLRRGRSLEHSYLEGSS
jgi:ABC-type multidrug transport system ATPase subunit